VVRALFGSPQQRSPLYFADLAGLIGDTALLDTLRDSHEQQQSLIRPSVAINRQLGTAENQRLLFQETAPESMRFYAARAITGRIADHGQAALLWVAIRLTPRWGSAKSRGLGWASVEPEVWVDGQLLRVEALSESLRGLVQRLELP